MGFGGGWLPNLHSLQTLHCNRESFVNYAIQSNIASGTYKLLQRMTERGLIAACKEGNKWVYSCVCS